MRVLATAAFSFSVAVLTAVLMPETGWYVYAAAVLAVMAVAVLLFGRRRRWGRQAALIGFSAAAVQKDGGGGVWSLPFSAAAAGALSVADGLLSSAIGGSGSSPVRVGASRVLNIRTKVTTAVSSPSTTPTTVGHVPSE